MNTTSKTPVELVRDILRDASIRFGVEYVGEQESPWPANQSERAPSRVDAWRISLDRENVCGFSQMYYTGIGLRSTRTGKPATPNEADVLHSLLQDASATHESFDDWCDNYDHSNDSLAALRIYQDCCAIGRKLNKLLIPSVRHALQEALTDY